MDEADTEFCSGDTESDTPRKVPAGVASFVAQVVEATLVRTGHEEKVERFYESPILIGNAIGDWFKRNLPFLCSSDSRMVTDLTRDQHRELEQVITDNPADTAQFFGALFLDSIPTGLDAEGVRSSILETYSQVLNTIGMIAINLKTSLALRGFIHRDDCISYWHFNPERCKSEPWTFTKDGSALEASGALQVYLVEESTSDEALWEKNEEIRRSETRRLEKLADHMNFATIAKVREVRELSVHFDRISESTPRSPFLSGRRPEKKKVRIPNGAPALATMLASLVPALEAQSLHEQAFAHNMSDIDLILKDIRDWIE